MTVRVFDIQLTFPEALERAIVVAAKPAVPCRRANSMPIAAND